MSLGLKKVLRAGFEDASARVPEALKTELFRIRSSARELAQAGLLEESEGAYRVTALGREKL